MGRGDFSRPDDREAKASPTPGSIISEELQKN